MQSTHFIKIFMKNMKLWRTITVVKTLRSENDITNTEKKQKDNVGNKNSRGWKRCYKKKSLDVKQIHFQKNERAYKTDYSVATAATYTVRSISCISLTLSLLVFRQMDWAPAITEQGAAITGQRGDYGRLLCKVIGPRKWRTRWDYFLFLKIVEQSPYLDKHTELSRSKFFAMVS